MLWLGGDVDRASMVPGFGEHQDGVRRVVVEAMARLEGAGVLRFAGNGLPELTEAVGCCSRARPRVPRAQDRGWSAWKYVP